ncbi:MAG: N-acetylmuramoyl-L-alanine amidase [Lachnospiraceae bacterium]
MDMEYIRQRKIKHRRQYRIKVASTIALVAVLLIVSVVWICKLVSDSGSAKENPTQSGQEGNSVLPGSKGEEKDAPDATQPIGTPDATQPTGTPSATPTEQPTPTPTAVPAPKVAIDAGHGDHDLGSTRDGKYEKNINLAIALEVDRLLTELGYETFMIRSDDTFVELEERSRLAVESGADIFVSIHQNALDNDTTTGGTEVWYNERNNEENVRLAKLIVNAVTAQTGSKNRGVKVGNSLIVLKGLEIPSCLVECGFISSEAERANLLDPSYQLKIAKGIVEGIQSYLPLPESAQTSE